jgi:hypothetical protein
VCARPEYSLCILNSLFELTVGCSNERCNIGHYLTSLYVPENEIDGFTLFNLTESDLSAMFPAKIGIVRKLSTLIKNLRSSQVRTGR